MDTAMLAELVFSEATNGDRSAYARRQKILRMIDDFVHAEALSEYHRGRADGAIEACRGLGGMDGSPDELKAALERSEK
jgi:hypothetical protein